MKKTNQGRIQRLKRDLVWLATTTDCASLCLAAQVILRKKPFRSA